MLFKRKSDILDLMFKRGQKVTFAGFWEKSEQVGVPGTLVLYIGPNESGEDRWQIEDNRGRLHIRVTSVIKLDQNAYIKDLLKVNT